MSKFILFTNGILAARYDVAIHGDNIPQDAIAVTDELFFQTINEQDGIWNLVDGEIVKLPFPPADPEVIKNSQWIAIQDLRTIVKNGGVLVGSDWFHSDDASRIQQLGLKDEARDLIAEGGLMTDQLEIGGDPVIWKTMAGEFVPMTAQLAFDIVAAIGVLDKAAFGVAEYHRAQMNVSADPGAYDFSAGWPATYQAA